MSSSTIVALAATLFVLACVPGPGILLVVSRTLATDFRQGFYTSLGIVAGDFVYILLVVTSLAYVADQLGALFVAIKTGCALYLIFLGLHALIFAATAVRAQSRVLPGSSFFVGLLTTLANPKAIIFYLGFLPAFIDIQHVSTRDVLIVLGLAGTIVGGVMTTYAFTANKSKAVLKSARLAALSQKIAGSIFLITGAWILLQR